MQTEVFAIICFKIKNQTMFETQLLKNAGSKQCKSNKNNEMK